VSAERRAEWTQQCIENGYEVIEYRRDSPPTEPFICVVASVGYCYDALCDWKETNPACDSIVHFVSEAVFTSTAADPLGAFPASIDAFRRVFQGLTFHFCTQGSWTWDHAMSSAMKSLGGRVETELTDSVTHVIAAEEAMTKTYRAALRQKKTITDWNWIADCFKAGLITIPHVPKPLEGARISCVNLSDEEVETIKREVEANGGEYIEDAADRQLTHVISGYPVQDRGHRWVPVFGRLWLEEMLDPDSPMVDPEAPYPPMPREEEDAIRASWKREKDANRQSQNQRAATSGTAAAAVPSAPAAALSSSRAPIIGAAATSSPSAVAHSRAHPATAASSSAVPMDICSDAALPSAAPSASFSTQSFTADANSSLVRFLAGKDAEIAALKAAAAVDAQTIRKLENDLREADQQKHALVDVKKEAAQDLHAAAGHVHQVERAKHRAEDQLEEQQQRLVTVKQENVDKAHDLERERGAKRKVEDELEEEKEHHQQRVAQHQAEKAQLEQKVEELTKACVVCLDAPPSIRFAPCKHVVICAGCDSDQMAECPICRAAVEEKQPILML
jgi:chemotaxis protein histidine kinase CheA